MSDYKSKITFPPASNWYCANILSVGPSGWVCWGAKNSLVLVQNSEDGDENDGYPQVVTHHDAHGDRTKVTAVAWCPDSQGVSRDKVVLVSGADDGLVKSWRLVHGDSGPGLVQTGQFSTDTGRVTSSSWSKADPGLVMVAGEAGTVVHVWDLVTSSVRSCNYGKQMVFTVQCHPTKSDILALGCKLGLVLIVNTQGTGRILQRMRGHDEDVYGLAWSPGSGVSIGETSYDEMLLASSSRDRTIRVWSEREGRSVHVMRLPSGDRRSGGKDVAAWITCAWPSPATILSGGVAGELLAWHLDKPGKKGGSEWSVVNREHFKNLFSLVVSDQGQVYTVGQDRLMVVTHLDTGNKVYSLPCFAGFVYTLQCNPIEPSTLAIGAGDGQIRIWRTGDSKDKFSMRMVGVKQAKVMSLAWHPTKEGLLAYGTDEGRVCWVDVMTGGGRSAATLSQYQHRGGVYCVTWLDTRVLVTCGDGKIVRHCTNSCRGEEIQLKSAGSNTGKSQVIMYDRGDMKLFILGYEDGSIQVYQYSPDISDSPFTLLANIKSQTKLIQSLALHPQYNADGSEAKFSNYLASANNEFPIHIFDLTNILQTTDVTSPQIVVTPHLTLTGHLQRVIEVAWSNHQSNLLCSVSYDFSCQVWDVATGDPLHNFSGHNGRVMTCTWHPTLASLVISGSEDGTLHVWDPTEQPRKLPLERKKEKRGKKFQESNKEPEVPDGVTVPVKDVKELSFDELLALHRSEQSRDKESSPASQVEARNATVEESVEKPRQILKPSSNRERKVKTVNKKLYFPTSSNEESNSKSKTAEDCVTIHEYYKEKVSKRDENIVDAMQSLELSDAKDKVKARGKVHLGFFTSREAVYDLLEAEKRDQADDVEAGTVLSLWSGDLDTVIEAAITESRVTERLVAQAAGVSVALWRRAAASLGKKLVREGEVLQGAEYLVSAGHVVEGVHELSKHGHFRSAVAVARCRLPHDSEVVEGVMRSWAGQCQADGNYSLAAKCWLSVGRGTEAGECLARLGTLDRGCIRLASVVTGDDDKRVMFARKCLVECCLSGDLKLAKTLIKDHPDQLSWSLPLLTATGYLMKITNTNKISDKVVNGTSGSAEPLLQRIRKDCSDFEWTDDNLEKMKQFVSTITCQDRLVQVLITCASFLVQAIHVSNSKPQESLSHVATCISQLSTWQDACYKVLQDLFPVGVGTAPDVGKAVLGQALDWQCNWIQVRSIQALHANIVIKHWKQTKQDVTEDEIYDTADGVMLDDVIKRQKLEAEIKEGEEAIANFTGEAGAEDEKAVGDKDCDVAGEPSKEKVDLTPSLSGTQTLSLSADGEWQSEGVSESVPLPPPTQSGDRDDSLPPPPPPCRSFHDRFLAGRSSSVDAKKEVQKLIWTRDRSTAAVAVVPFPDLTDACMNLVEVMRDRGIGGGDDHQEDAEGKELDIRRRVARWAYYHGRRDLQGYFVKHS